MVVLWSHFALAETFKRDRNWEESDFLLMKQA